MHEQELKTQVRLVCVTCSRCFANDITICPHDGSELTPESPDAWIGTIVGGHYEVIELLGKGGMSSVYKARQIMVDKLVAIKIMHTHMSHNPQSIRRFQQEAKATFATTHQNLVSVHDFGVSSDFPYIVMDYLEGESLGALLDREGKLSIDRCLGLFLQVLDGLQHVHSQNVIHRDLKPSNIMILKDGNGDEKVKIVDFGIAKIMDQQGDVQKLTQTGEIFGSPLYMSPEQCASKAADARSDLYSVGCAMYECLSGSPPLDGSNVLSTINMHLNEIPRSFHDVSKNLNIPDKLEKAVFKALEKDPAKRYQSAQEFASELKAARYDKQVVSILGMPIVKLESDLKRLTEKETQINLWKVLSKVALTVMCCGVAFAATYALSADFRKHANASLVSAAWQLNETLANIANATGNYPQAQMFYDKALEVADRHPTQADGTYLKLNSMQHHINLLKQHGDYIKADRIAAKMGALKLKQTSDFMYENKQDNILERSVALLPKATDRESASSRAFQLDNFGRLQISHGHPELSIPLFEESVKLDEDWKLGDRKLAPTLAILGTSYVMTGNFQKAEAAWERAYKITPTIENYPDYGVSLALNMGRMRQEQGRFEEALPFFENAVKMAKEAGQSLMIETALKDQEAFFRKSGQSQKADAVHRELSKFAK